MKKKIYKSPFLKIFEISKKLNFLHSLSAEGSIEDFIGDPNFGEYEDFQ